MKGSFVSVSDCIEFLTKKGLFIQSNNIQYSIKQLSGIQDIQDNSLIWLRNTSFKFPSTKRVVALVGEKFEATNAGQALIFTKDPKLAFVLIANEFFVNKKEQEMIHKSVSIGNDVIIGKNLIAKENVVIGNDVKIGDNVTIHSNVTIYGNCEIGDNVIIHAGASIGQDGFGYIQDLDGKNIQFPHIGKVILRNNVEIGSNTCIDRGALSDTIVGENSKIDNLCHIAHNVQIGSNCLIIANAEVSGSSIINNNVYIGPNATIIDGVSIAEGSVIGMGAVVRSSLDTKNMVLPFESMTRREYIKALKKLKS